MNAPVQNIKKIGFFTKNKSKITRGLNVAVNLSCIIGIGVTAVLHLIAPPLAFLSIPSVITLVLHWASKNAPETLEDIKKLFLSTAESESDRESVNRAYEEIVSTLSQTARTIQPEAPYVDHVPVENVSNEPIFDDETSEDSQVELTQRLPVRLVYNTKTKQMESQIDE